MFKTQTCAPERRRLLAVIDVCLVASLSVVLPTAALSQQRKNASNIVRRITLGVVVPHSSRGDSSASSVARGITLGIEEAQRSARLFGWDVVVVAPPDSLSDDDAIRLLTSSRVTALVGNLTGTLQNLPVVNPVSIETGRRRRGVSLQCDEREFHLLPLLDSAQWTSAGRRQSFSRYSGLVAWDPSLERFGAAQLNQRYQRRFGSAMDEQAWAGWMSVKLVLDAVLRIKSAEPCVLERFLISGDARFDGHKGVPLFFDPQTRELVQPLAARVPGGEAELVDVMTSHNAMPSRSPGGAACPAACT